MLRCIFPTVCLALIAAGSAMFAQEEIVIGEYASLTGGSASFGQSSHKGTALAIDEINAAGGVLGKKLKLVTEDDQSQAGQPATIVRKLISQDKAVAVLGEVASSKSLEAAPICQQNKIPDDLARLDQSEGHGGGRLHFPCLLHRPLPREQSCRNLPNRRVGRTSLCLLM